MGNNIILIGYMGCGKSSVGKKLAERYDMEYVDLDAYIEANENQSILTIFASKGEVYFRKIEGMYLKECLDKYTNIILSLGGGTPCFGSNMDLILNTDSASSVYLNTSIGELAKRLFTEKDKRPLIAHTKTIEELTEFIAKHIFERSAYYQKAAHMIKTDSKSVAEIAIEVYEVTKAS